MRATPTNDQEDGDPGDAMLMMITRVMWTTLVIQGKHERPAPMSPGAVLDKALREYLERNGSPEAVAYLHEVADGG